MTIPHQEHICGPGCQHGASPADEKLIREEFQVARRSFLRDAMVVGGGAVSAGAISGAIDRKSTRLNSSHLVISYAVFCLKKKKVHTSSSRHRVEHSVPSSPRHLYACR